VRCGQRIARAICLWPVAGFGLAVLVGLVGAALLLVAAPAAARPQDGPSGPADLEPVPRPAEGAVEPAVARELAAAHDQVEARTAGWSPASGSDATEALADAYATLGRLDAAYGLWDAARAAFADAVTLAPRDRESVYLLGYVLERQGRLTEAETRYRRASELAPGATAPKVRRARVLLELDRGDEAEPLFEELARRQASSAAGHFGLGLLAARRGDAASAARHFEAVLERQPGAGQVHYPLALAYRRLGDLDGARRQLSLHAAAGDDPGRVAFPDPLVDGLAAAAGGASLHKFRGDQLLLGGDEEGAAAAYRRAVEADPESFWARKSLGLTLWDLGRGPEAERELEAALELDPSGGTGGSRRMSAAQVRRERSRLLFALGGIAANGGRSGQALERFEKAAALDPGYAEPWLQIGNLHGQAGRREQALEAFGRALDRDPGLTEARLQRATTLMDLGRFAEAVPELERVVAERPDDARARQLLRIARDRQ